MHHIFFALWLWLGLVVIVWGLYGRAATRGRWCRRCLYPLMPGQVEHCPECGADLRRRCAIGRGRRVGRRAVVVAGVLLIAAVGIGRYGHRLANDVEARPGWLPVRWLPAER